MKFDGLEGLKYFIRVKMNQLKDEIQDSAAYETYSSVLAKGRFEAYKEVLDLIEAFQKANEEVVFEEETE